MFTHDVITVSLSSQGQLGLGDTKDRYIPFIVSAFHSDPKHSRVSVISCGARHAAAMTSSGRLYTWGDSSYGQLGLDDTQARSYPTCVTALATKRMRDVQCGSRSTLAVTETGEVVVWGMTSW